MQHNTMTVAIQGGRASFHEIAATKYYQQPVQLVFCRSFEEVFSLLKKGNVDRAFVAVSNSNHGEIDDVQGLIEDNDVQVEGEYALPIEQNIIGLQGTDLSQIRKIISHPIALSQCQDNLAKKFGKAKLESYYDTSAAVEYVRQLNDTSIVAIASDMAADVFGLTILCHAIQDDPDNITIFQSLSNKQ